MFKFTVSSKELEEAMREMSLGIPNENQNGENGCIKVCFYKVVPNQKISIGVLLAYNGSIQAGSTFQIHDVVSEKDSIEIHVNGKKMNAMARAFATMDTILDVTVDKEMMVESEGNRVSLQLGQEITTLKLGKEVRQQVEMKTDDFANFVNFSTSCYGEKNARGLHCVGIRIDEERKKIVGVSSNAFKCAYAEGNIITAHSSKNHKNNEVNEETKSENEADKGEDVITTVLEGALLKMAVKNLRHEKVTLSVTPKSFHIKCGTNVIIIVTHEIPFPYDAILSVKQNFKKKGSWKAPIAKVFQAFSIYEITMEDFELHIEQGADKQINLHGKDDATSASVSCAVEGEIDKMVLNEKELKTALSIFGKEKDIIVETMSAEKPIAVRQNEKDANHILVLPVANK